MMEYVKLECNGIVFVFVIFGVVLLGGFFEIVFLFMIENIVEEVEGMCFYILFELVGWDIYVCEGCYVCYSQMICILCLDVDCYGYFSLVVEFMYDYLYQWGFKCMGLDLVWVGNKYFDIWYVVYLEVL